MRQLTMSMRKPGLAIVLFTMMLLPLVYTATAEGQPSPPTINTSWIKGDNGLNEHAYTVAFADNGSYQIEVDITHLHNGEALANEVFISWSSVDEKRMARAVTNTTLSWGDEVTVSVRILSWDGTTLTEPLVTARSFTVGTWNQPMADHEVLLKTSWDLDQTYVTEDGEQGFSLAFNGQGWQMREGVVLNSGNFDYCV